MVINNTYIMNVAQQLCVKVKPGKITDNIRE